MLVPEGYKQTEVGVIPKDWTCDVWGNVFKGFSSGATPYRAIDRYYKGNIKWVSSGELNYNTILETIEHISEEAMQKANLTIHPAGTFLMAITGLEASGTRGSCAILGCDATTNQSCMALYGTDKVNVNYLRHYYVMNGDDLAFKFCQGTKQQSYTAKIVKRLPIAYPPLPEQEAITKMLSDADTLISSLEKLILKKKAIKQGTMQQLLSGKKRLPGFSGEWVEMRVGDFGDFYGGLSGKTKNDFGCGSATYITFLNVLSNVWIDISILEKVNVKESENQNQVQIGDLFFNTSSETPEEVGKCSVLLADLPNTYLNSFCFGFRLNTSEVNPLFLPFYFNSDEGRKIMRVLAQGATRYNLSKNNFADTVITLPEYTEQNDIADILSDMDTEIKTLQKKLSKVRNIKQGMMQELITGRIRLIDTTKKVKPQSALVTGKQREQSKQGHNKHIEDAALIAAIVDAFYSDKYPLGRVKIQKLLYLLRRKQEASVAAFKKKAAGPYADEVRYKGGEPIARNNKYIVTSASDKGTRYSKGTNISQALGYIEKWNMQDDIDWLKSNFLHIGRNELELLATIDMAMCDLTGQGKKISPTNIKELIRSDKEWNAKLKKTYFSDIDIQRAIKENTTLFG